MIPLAGTSLGALSPWFLAAIPLAAISLVYIFRARGVGQPRVISSLFILQKLPQYLPSRRTFTPPLEFWLELLASILLALAAAGVFLADSDTRIAILVDNSKSMASLQTTGESRLTAAKRIAAADISASAADTCFVLTTALSSAESNNPNTADRLKCISASRATRLLNSLEQSFGSDQLQARIDSLVASKQYDSVWVYTDKHLNSDRSPAKLKVTTIPTDPARLANVWIDRAVIASDTQTAPSIEVQISAVGTEPLPVELSAICSDTISNIEFSLGPRRQTIRPAIPSVAELGPLNRAWSYCRIQVETASSSPTKDLLDLDNSAWIAHTSSETSILLYSPLSLQALGLSALPYRIIESSAATNPSTQVGAIYHRMLPNTPPEQEGRSTNIKAPRTPSMVISPPANSVLWSNGAVLGTAQKPIDITRWDTTHPLLQYVQPTLVSIPTATILRCPETSTPILFSNTGPIACAGEEGGARYVLFGFELFPFDGLRSPTISIVTLNALRWITNTAGGTLDSSPAGSSARGYESIRVPSGTTLARMLAPQERVIASSTVPATISAPYPGVIALENGIGEGKTTNFVAVNSFSPQESDLSKTHTISISALADPQKASNDLTEPLALKRTEQRTLESTLTWALLAVLLLDLIRRILRRSGWGEIR